MSTKLTTAPTVRPWSSSGWLAYSAWKGVPSARHSTSSSMRQASPTRKALKIGQSHSG